LQVRVPSFVFFFSPFSSHNSLFTCSSSRFAGGTVVHVTAGFSALVASLVVGKRSAIPDSTRAHNVPFVLLGAALLTFGWFGFNGGSAFSAKDGMAALACVRLTCFCYQLRLPLFSYQTSHFLHLHTLL
jgi:ammonia channel protein AmtB